MATLFRDKVLKKAFSPEQYDKMVPMVNPLVYLAVTGAIVISLIVALWGFLGRVPEYLYIECAETSLYQDNILFVPKDQSNLLEENMTVIFEDGSKGKIESIARKVSSNQEIEEVCGDIPDEIKSESVIMVKCSGDQPLTDIETAKIVIKEITPFQQLIIYMKELL